jgi:hypothetical protein
MVNTTKVKSEAAETKPWVKQGITWQKWNQQNRKQQASSLAERLSSISTTGGISEMDAVAHDNVLINDFLDRCEFVTSGDQPSPMSLSSRMVQAIYNTLRSDGH